MKNIIAVICVLIATIGIKVNALTINTTNDIGDAKEIIEIALNEKEIYNKRYVIFDDGSENIIIFNKEDYEVTQEGINIMEGTRINKNNNIITVDNSGSYNLKINNEVYSNVTMDKAKKNLYIEMYGSSKWKEILLIYGLGMMVTIVFVKGVLE